MLIPGRLRLIVAIAVSAYALVCCPLAARGQVSPAPASGGVVAVKQEDLARLIAAAKAAGVAVDYSASTTTEEAAGKGSTVDASGDAAKVEHDSTAPNVRLRDGTTADGGDSIDKAMADVSHARWYQWLLGIIGLGLIGCGVWKFKQAEIDTALSLAGAGAVCIVCAIWPGLMVIMVLAAVLPAIAHVLPDKLKSAYHGLVDGIGTAPPGALTPELVKAIKSQTTRADRTHIETTAAANGNPISLV